MSKQSSSHSEPTANLLYQENNNEANCECATLADGLHSPEASGTMEPTADFQDIAFGGIIAHNTYINTSSAKALKVEDSAGNTNVLVVDTANGRVGIGTAATGAGVEIYDKLVKITNVGLGDDDYLLTVDNQLNSDANDGLRLHIARANRGNLAHLVRMSIGNTVGSPTIEAFYINSNGNVGIGTASPTNLLSLGGTAARTIWMERNTTAATAGQGLTIHSGGAIAGTANLAGGNLTLSSGISTGTGSSNIYFNTATAGASDANDRTPSTKMTILGNGNVGIGTATPSSLLSVGATSQFQVNSSGAIAAVVGITNTGAYSQTGATANTFSGASSFTSAGTGLAVANNATIGGTLGVTGLTTLATGSTIGNLTLANGSITDSGGSISFDNENLSTTGTLGAGAATFTSLSTGSGSITGGAGSFTTLTSSGNTTLGTGASSINTIGSVTTPGALTLRSGGTSAWTNASGNLTVSTTTSGTLALTSAGALNLTGAAASVWSVTSGGLTVNSTSANLGLQTTTSGNITLAPASTGSVQITSGVTTGTATSSGLSLAANSLTSGYGLSLSSTSAGLTTGRLLSLDWSPTSATATGDLFNINIGSGGTVGNLLNITDNGSTLFSVSETAIISNLPHSFTAAGDVSMSYDLLFTNQTASYIKSNAPLYLEAGEVFESNDLTLKTYNQGTVVVDSAATTGNMFDILGSTLTSGNGIRYTGPTVTGITGNAMSISSAIGSAGKLVSLAPNFTGSTVTGYGIYQAATDSTAVANIDYGYYSALTLTGNAAKTGTGIYSTVSSASTTADTLAALDLATSATGAITSGTRTIYGSRSQPASTAASSGTQALNLYGSYLNPSSTLATAGTTNVYGQYITSTATHAADAGTVNQYGLYVANGTSSTFGAATKYGLYVESPTGADSNYAAVFAGGNVGIGTTTPSSLLSVGATSQFQVNSSGAIAAVVGITNSGNLTFSGATPAISASTADTAISLDAGTTGKIKIGGTSTGDIDFAGGSTDTGCTITAAGVLTCSGNITGPAAGTIGYWSRTGTSLNVATANDSLSITGTGTFGTGTGAISLNGDTSVTSANTLTVGSGLTTLGGGLTVNGITNINAAVCGDYTVQDADSNIYNTVLIGTQCWLKQNLRTGTQLATGNTTPSNNGIIEKWCPAPSGTAGTVDNLQYAANCVTDGGLYQWNEAMGYITTAGAQGICPTGWHISTDAQQYALENYLKDTGQTCDANRSGVWDCDTAGTKLKVGGVSGFEGVLAGYRYTNGTFYNRLADTNFWSSSQYGASNAWKRGLYSGYSTVLRSNTSKAYGFSVRCLKDDNATTIDSTGILNLGATNSLGISLGKAATTLTINPTAWTATPTISGLTTLTSGFDSNAASTVVGLTVDGNGNLIVSNGTLSVTAPTITGNAGSIIANSLTTGTGLDISSTSTAGTGSDVSKLLNLSRSGANSNSSHIAYGLYSNVANTGTTSTNVAGYFSASGATNNYGLIVENGNVGIGTATPSARLTVRSDTAGTVSLFQMENLVTAAVDTAGSINFYANRTTSGTTQFTSLESVVTSIDNASWSSKLNIKVASNGTLTTMMEIGNPNIVLNRPLQVNVAGDTGISYDLAFLSTGNSSITSYGPLTIAAGDPNHAKNLTLTTQSNQAAGESGVVVSSTSQVTTVDKTLTDSAWIGGTISIVSGTGSGQVRDVLANSATTVTVDDATTTTDWSPTPDATSVYHLAYSRGGDVLVNIQNSDIVYGGFKVLGMGGGGYVFRVSPNGNVEIGGSGSDTGNLTVKGSITLTGGDITGSQLSLSATAGLTSSTSNTGGSLSGNSISTYYYKLTAINAKGETIPQATTKTQALTAISAPSTALTATDSGTAGNVDIGDHSWKVTFTTANGETNPSAKSNVVTIATSAKQVNLTAIPTGQATVTTSRKIYRTVAGDTGDWKLVGAIADNTTTTFTDNVADASLGAIAPVANTAYTSTNTITLSWDQVVGATGYKLYRGTNDTWTDTDDRWVDNKIFTSVTTSVIDDGSGDSAGQVNPPTSNTTGGAGSLAGNLAISGAITAGATTSTHILTGMLCIKNSTACPAQAAGRLYVDTAGTASDDPGDVFDIAEYYPTIEPVEPGDVVSITAPEGEDAPKFAVKKSDQPYEKSLIGVVSARPAIAIEESFATIGSPATADPLKPLIALVGRVRVKVSTENGPISLGDPLTASSQSGIAMRADKAGRVIGVALESFDSAESGVVRVFVNPHWYGGQLDSTGSLQVSGDDSLPETSSGISDSFTSAIKNSLNKLGLLMENGIAKVKEIIAEKITTKEICLKGENGETVCIDKNQLKQLLEQNNIAAPAPPSPTESKENCLSNSGYWYDNICNAEPENPIIDPVCDAGNLDLCSTQDLCEGASLYWYNDVCNIKAKI